MLKSIHKPFFLVAFYFVISGWGFSAHRTINYSAIFTLPPEMFGFYKDNIYFIENKAVNPDKRRYIDTSEAPRHYLDFDFYEQVLPIDTIPKFWDSAVSVYGLQTLRAHGIVPWHVNLMVYKLTEAFAKQDAEKIIRLSADLGHYVGDLHVPLHSTHNYNGQLTNQEGIHGLWETRLVELYINNYDLLVGKAEYISNISDQIWQSYSGSVAATDSVLRLEREATKRVGESKKYIYEQRGATLRKTYSKKFCKTYNKLLDQMVENRMRASINLLGNLWLTAWVDGGQPNLDTLVFDNPSNAFNNKLDSLWQRLPIIGRDEVH